MPDQLPFVVLSVWPSSGVPEITGAAVFAGASASTSSVAAEVDRVDAAAVAGGDHDPDGRTHVRAHELVRRAGRAGNVHAVRAAASQRRHW